MIFRGSFLPGKRSVARTVHKVALPGACASRGFFNPHTPGRDSGQRRRLAGRSGPLPGFWGLSFALAITFPRVSWSSLLRLNFENEN